MSVVEAAQLGFRITDSAGVEFEYLFAPGVDFGLFSHVGFSVRCPEELQDFPA